MRTRGERRSLAHMLMLVFCTFILLSLFPPCAVAAAPYEEPPVVGSAYSGGAFHTDGYLSYGDGSTQFTATLYDDHGLLGGTLQVSNLWCLDAGRAASGQAYDFGPYGGYEWNSWGEWEMTVSAVDPGSGSVTYTVTCYPFSKDGFPNWVSQGYQRFGGQVTVTYDWCGGLELYKALSGPDADPSLLEGVRFELVSQATGDLVETLVLDATGYAATVPGALPFGVYDVCEVEDSLPDTVQPWSQSSGSGSNVCATVTVDSKALLRVDVTDYTKRSVEAWKSDIDTAAPVPDTEYTLYRIPVALSDGLITSDTAAIRSDDPAWVALDTLVTDGAGRADFGLRDFGYYKLVETRPAPGYLSDLETRADEGGGTDGGEGSDRQPLDAAVMFAIDKNTTSVIQMFEDRAVQLSCTTYKHTIARTSSALDARAHGLVNNVGTEEYLYRFGAASTSNTLADEFVVTSPIAEAESHGLRVTTLWSGTATGDVDGRCTVQYRTNHTAPTYPSDVREADLLSPDFQNPNNVEGRLQYSLEPGWLTWASDVSTSTPRRFEVSDLGLAQDEYLTGIRVLYGDVTRDFSTGCEYGNTDDWCYAVKASRALQSYQGEEETVICSDVSAAIARNWSAEEQRMVLTDEASDRVETRVIDSFSYGFDDRDTVSRAWHSSASIPQMGDVGSDKGMLFAGLSALFAGIVLAIRRRLKRGRARRA